MANWSRNTISLAGPGVPQIVAYVNSHMEPVDQWSYVDLAPLLTAPPEDLRAGLNLYHEDVPLRLDNQGATQCFCETKGQPPLEALVLLSKQFPGLSADVTWSIEYEYISRGVRITNGMVTVIRDGDFILAEKGEPVHHWLVEVTTPESMAAIEAADVTVLMPSGRWWHQREGFRRFSTLRLRDSEIAKVRAIPGISCTPFTLDEKSFLSGIEPGNYPTELDPFEAAIWVKVCERRHVTLTPEEVAAVRQKTEAAAKTPDELSFHEADRYHVYPTAHEIAWLLPLSTEERRKELQAALDKPEWTTKWPEWEERRLNERYQSEEDNQN